MQPSFASLRARILGAFALHALMVGALPTRLPDIQMRLGLDEATLGMVLTVSAIGALAMFFFSAGLVARFGTRWLILAVTGLGTFAAALMPLAPSVGWLLPLNLVFGAAAALGSMAMNVEADRIEAATGRRVMNTCHGAWSIALFVVSLAGAGLRAAGLAASLHLAAMAALSFLLLALIVGPMVAQPERTSAPVARRRSFSWPTRATLGIVAFGVGGDLLHGASTTWSIIFVRDVFDTTRFIEGLALPAFVIAMAAARLTADRWLDWFPAVTVARAHLGLALFGLVVLVAAPVPAAALAGFAMIGAGVSVVYPMMISAAAQLGDRPAAQNVAAMTLVVQVLMLGAPLMIGALAEAFSLRVAFAAFVPLLLVGLYMAHALVRPAAPAVAT